MTALSVQRTPARSNARLAGGAAFLGFLLIAGQRFGISFGSDSIQFASLVLIFIVVWAVVFARAKILASSLILYLALVATSTFSTLIGTSFATPSLSALLLLLATYLVTLVSKGSTGLGPKFLAGAMWAIRIGAVLGLAQFGAQTFGLGFVDPVRSLPPEIIVSGFNSYYSLEFAGGYAGQFKPNGIIFLEPSFLSLFTALGIVYTFWRLFTSTDGRRREVFWLIVLAGGFAVSASASGFVVILAASLVMLFTVRRNRALLVGIVAVLLIALFAGFFDAVIAKASEGISGVSSTSLRLVLPYQLLTPFWAQHPLFGWGAGMSSTIIESFNYLGLQASTLMKALVEYGMAGAAVIGAIVVRALWSSKAPIVLIVAMASAWLIPAEALVSPVLVGLMLFAIPHWEAKDSLTRRSTGTEQNVLESALYQLHGGASFRWGCLSTAWKRCRSEAVGSITHQPAFSHD